MTRACDPSLRQKPTTEAYDRSFPPKLLTPEVRHYENQSMPMAYATVNSAGGKPMSRIRLYLFSPTTWPAKMPANAVGGIEVAQRGQKRDGRRDHDDVTGLEERQHQRYAQHRCGAIC